MITVTNAQIYSIENKTAMAYEITYSEGSVVRAAMMNDGFIRCEYKNNGQWKVSCEYIVKKNKKRQGERMIERVKKFLEV